MKEPLRLPTKEVDGQNEVRLAGKEPCVNQMVAGHVDAGADLRACERVCAMPQELLGNRNQSERLHRDVQILHAAAAGFSNLGLGDSSSDEGTAIVRAKAA